MNRESSETKQVEREGTDCNDMIRDKDYAMLRRAIREGRLESTCNSFSDIRHRALECTYFSIKIKISEQWQRGD